MAQGRANGQGAGGSRGNGAGSLPGASDPDEPARVGVARSRHQADEWALVLAAEGLSAHVAASPEGYGLWVPPHQAGLAVTALEAYWFENRRAAVRSASTSWAPLRTSVLIALALILFFAVTHSPRTGLPWIERGAADATRICAGEPWRAVTALTLHADLGHVLANAVVGTIFLAALFEALGPGVGAGLVLASGALGNGLNACLRSAPHLSVGASTAVFGALGLLAAVGFARRRREGRGSRRAWIPLGGALALLAMLGTGPQSDLGAHAFGLAAGVALGAAAALAGMDGPPGRAWQWLAGTATSATVAGSWLVGLG